MGNEPMCKAFSDMNGHLETTLSKRNFEQRQQIFKARPAKGTNFDNPYFAKAFGGDAPNSRFKASCLCTKACDKLKHCKHLYDNCKTTGPPSSTRCY